jgi:serine protease Do
VVLRDRRRDLAALRIDPADRPFAAEGTRTVATIGEPSTLRAGDVVVANGHPLGIEHALSLGVVHTAPRDAAHPYISADIRLAPGNSGGPLADASGRVVGVNSMIVGGLGVAISVDAVRRMLAASQPRPSLGVQLRPVQVRVPARTGDASVGLLVLGCEPRGAAARAGILPGDVLLGFAGHPFRSADELALLLRDIGANAPLRLDVGRANKQLSITVQLGAAERLRTDRRQRAA